MVTVGSPLNPAAQPDRWCDKVYLRDGTYLTEDGFFASSGSLDTSIHRNDLQMSLSCSKYQGNKTGRRNQNHSKL